MKCVILAGGSGNRLWPLSRRTYPKQFMEMQENRSLLQETIVRNMPYCEEFIIVTNAAYKFIVEGQLQAFQGLKYRCIYEEESRNTGVPVSLICMISNPSELLYVVPSDIVLEGGHYMEYVLSAMQLAREGYIVTFGITAKEANPRFGYICRNGTEVIAFHEKPSKDKAIKYLAEEDCLWNSGMFLACAGDFLQQLKIHQPQFYRKCRECVQEISMLHADIVLPSHLLQQLPVLSVEKAVFEHSNQLKVVEADFQWVDIDELEDTIPYLSKCGHANVIAQDCDNISIVNRAKRQLVAANQLQDMIIINTEDVLYLAPKGADAEGIMQMIQTNQEEYGHYFERNRIAYRQWGCYEILSQDNGFQVKRVTIYPSKTIYRHRHGMRSEHWSIVSGRAVITLQEHTQEYHRNESIYVPKGVPHEVSNAGEENLIIIEVGIGETITESDMVRETPQERQFRFGQAESISRLEPAYKDYLWGGTKLKDMYRKRCDYAAVAESWELSAHPAGQSVIAEGRYRGMLFGDYIRRIDKTNLGWKCQNYEQFPILIKFIDAKSNLSIQVHPADEYALAEEGEYGKNEMWYILDCEEGAVLYCGFKRAVTKEEVQQAAEEEWLLELLNEVPVHKGDTIFIPAGTIHAIGAGILVCEIQQNSNSTYRIYDYGRKDKYGNKRALHLDKALQVLNLDRQDACTVIQHEKQKGNGYVRQLLGQCKYFESIKVEVEKQAEILLEDASFTAVVVLNGAGEITADEKTLEYCPGDTFFIPAGKKKLLISGKGKFIFNRV